MRTAGIEQRAVAVAAIFGDSTDAALWGPFAFPRR